MFVFGLCVGFAAAVLAMTISDALERRYERQAAEERLLADLERRTKESLEALERLYKRNREEVG